MKKLLFLIFLIPVLCFSAIPDTLKRITIFRTPSTIKIDGVIEEEAWLKAEKAHSFWQQYPFDSSYAATKTEAMLTYDDEFLYVAAVCYDETEGDFVVQSLKRDFSYPVSDAFAVYIDPFCDLTNGFSFGVNPMGAQREGLLQYGGSMGVTTAWDNKWYSEVKHYKGYWTVEMAIPFKTLRFKENSKTWRINFGRNDLKRNENSSWVKVPRNFNVSTLSFTGELVWDEAPKKPKSNISLIPYGISTLTKDHVAGTPAKIKPNAGLDAKIALSSSLNLDLTFNPDFAQVEVDRQVTNLSRFSLFFPERRNFFIENSDIFERFGFRQIRPFFSRRVGLYNGSQVPIIAGARLSGKINKQWRIGVMNMQTAAVDELSLEAQNYSVAAVMYQLKGRSNVSGIFVNRQGFEGKSLNYSDYNRIAGFDWNIASMDNKIQGKIFYHHSFSPENNTDNFAHASWLMYQTPKWFLMWNHEYVGKNYNAETGFVPRVENYDPINDSVLLKSYWRWEPSINRKFYPNSKIVNNHGFEIQLSEYWDGQYKVTERELQSEYFVNFQNSASITAGVTHNKVKLFFDLDVTFSGDSALTAGYYNYNYAYLEFNSNLRKKFNVTGYADYGAYYTGKKITGSIDLNFRKQPWGIFAISAQANSINMPEGFADVNYLLVGPKFEFSFTRSLFFTTFIQYNTQIENVNINSRFQWRFKPMSDLFIVYTENYNSYNIGIKNRALAVKLVYWLNV